MTAPRKVLSPSPASGSQSPPVPAGGGEGVVDALLGVVEEAARLTAARHRSKPSRLPVHLGIDWLERAGWLGVRGLLLRSVPAEHLTTDVLRAARQHHHKAYMAAIGPWAPNQEVVR